MVGVGHHVGGDAPRTVRPLPSGFRYVVAGPEAFSVTCLPLARLVYLPPVHHHPGEVEVGVEDSFTVSLFATVCSCTGNAQNGRPRSRTAHSGGPEIVRARPQKPFRTTA